MKNRIFRKLSAAALLFGLTQFAVFAGDRTNAYAGIERRNIFSLRTAPPSANPPAVSTAPIQIRLTGIAVLFPEKCAILQIQESAKPVRSVLLSEGAKDSTVEVVEIDAQAKWVKILNSGLPMTLTFSNHSPKNSFLASAVPDPSHAPLPLVPPVEAGDR